VERPEKTPDHKLASNAEAHKYSNSNSNKNKNNSNQDKQQQQTKYDTSTRINRYLQHILFTVMNSSSHERKLEQEAPTRGLPRHSSLRRLDRKAPPQRGVQRNISFCDKVEKKVVDKIPHDSFLDVFYLEDEIAESRQQAFMEDCGFDPADFAE
jgi:hypothetical protein